MKQNQIGPRTIHFKETVQIKEIESVETQNERRPSWDPNIVDNKFFKEKPTKQKNVVIAIAVIGGILLAIIIGVVAGVVASQKTTTTPDESLSYNEKCQSGSKQCKSSQGLSCPNGFCVCSSSYQSWNPTTTSCTFLTYNQACSSSNQCDPSLSLTCLNHSCLCDPYHRWNSSSNTCVVILNNTLNYGDTCANGSAQCKLSLDLTCSTGICSCRNGKFWNNTNCVCPLGTFVNASNFCEPLHKINQSCTIAGYECDTSRGLFCNNSLCQCDFSTKYWNINFETCLQRLNYSESCSTDSDCLPTLICPTISGVCNCSQYLADYTCNCPNDKYFDSAMGRCLSRSTFNGTCITSKNYTCLLTMFCQNGFCSCPLGTNWISANNTCT